MGNFSKGCILPMIAWLVVTGADPDGLAVGVVAVAGAAALGLGLAAPATRIVRPLALAALVPRFLWRSLLGGVDVARRAFHPAMPLDPGWHVLPTRVPAGAPRVAIAGEFSLMPGTLVAGTRGDTLLVHCLDATAPVAEEVAAEERRLLSAIAAGPDAGRRGAARAGGGP